MCFAYRQTLEEYNMDDWSTNNMGICQMTWYPASSQHRPIFLIRYLHWSLCVTIDTCNTNENTIGSSECDNIAPLYYNSLINADEYSHLFAYNNKYNVTNYLVLHIKCHYAYQVQRRSFEATHYLRFRRDTRVLKFCLSASI